MPEYDWNNPLGPVGPDSGALIQKEMPATYDADGNVVDSGYLESYYQPSIWDPYTQQYIIPKAWDPYGAKGLLGGSWEMARGFGDQRLGAAQDYLQATNAGQSVARNEQALALGQTAQQQMGARAGGGLQERAAMYAGARQAEQQIAEQAQRRAQEQMVSQALLQNATGAGADQAMAEANQMQQLHGISYGREQKEIAGDVAAAEAKKAAEIDWEGIAGGAASVIGGMARSDRRLKRDVRRPTGLDEAELLKALRGGH